MSKEMFMKNYNSLIEKSNGDLSIVLEFCNYFQSDDINLFNEYKSYVEKGINVNNLIELYGKRYNLDPARDTNEIMKLFIKNTIQEGYVYHLSNSINNESIMKKGFGINSKGLETEEDKDYNLLKNTLDYSIFSKLEPFDKTKNRNTTFYSSVPILNARYGDRPEWLIELKNNFNSVKDELGNNSNLVLGIIDKYDKKYNNRSKQLYLLPNPIKTKLSDSKIDMLTSAMSAVDVINYLYSNVLKQKDMSTTEYISPDDILSVDLNTYKISYSKDGEIIEYSDSDKGVINSI